MALPCYLDGHSTSERAHEPTARRTSAAWRQSVRARTPPVAVDAATRGGRATALTWVVPRPKQGVGDRGLTESARRADPRAPADRAPRAARLARPLAVRAPPTGRWRGEWSEGAVCADRQARTRGRHGRFTQAPHEPPPAQLRRREPSRPRAPPPRAGVRSARASPIAIRTGGGGGLVWRGAPSEEKTRHDMTWRRTRGIRHDFTVLPRRPFNERACARADCTPHEHRVAPERVREHVTRRGRRSDARWTCHYPELGRATT